MNPEVKTKWVSRLRELDGKDKQGKGYLNRDGKMCCLGVLCEIAIEDGLEIHTALDPEDNCVEYSHNATYLPTKVQDWSGLPYNPDFRDDKAGTFVALSELNDDGVPFGQLADIIEREF